MKISIFIIIGCVFISCGSKQIITPLDAVDEFERALYYYENKKYDDAAQAFERIIFYHPSSEYVDDAQFWLGRTYFEKGDYERAVIEFDYLIKNFSRSIFAEQAHLYRAKSYFINAPGYEKDPTELMAAVSLLDNFLTQFPNSEYTEEIKEMILAARNRLAKKEVENGKLYIKLNAPNAALVYLNYVVKTYPETEVANEAKFYAAQLYEKKRETEKALAYYNELLEDSEWKEKAEKRIEELENKYPPQEKEIIEDFKGI